MFFEVKLLIYIPFQHVIVIINVERPKGVHISHKNTHTNTHIMYNKRTSFILQFRKGSFLL